MKDKILALHNLGLSNVAIAKQLGCCTNTVWRHLKSAGMSKPVATQTEIDWKYVQQLYDNGMSERDLRAKKIVSRFQLSKAKKQGVFIARSLSDSGRVRAAKYPLTQSDDFKKGQSERMKERHALGLAYTLGHNERLKQRSYPEQWFSTVIQSELQNISVVEQHPVGRYCLDFAWPDLKKCVEVDGETHYRFDAEITKDKKRDKWLLSQGWTILRFRWKEVVKNKEDTIVRLKKFVDENQTT